ncbi:MAG: hypothetical protein WCQ23_07475 [Candidatus Methanomethylophilaceae archaeon]
MEMKAKTRSKNKTSDRGKIHFFHGSKADDRQVANKTDYQQTLFADEVKASSTMKMRIVITWVPDGARKNFRKTTLKFPPEIKRTKEAKYSNVHMVDKLGIYENLKGQTCEIYDTIHTRIPDDVVAVIGASLGHAVEYWQSRYLYQLESAIREAMDNHRGQMDIVMDYPPFDIIDDVLIMCNNLVKDGYEIQWYTIAPSRHIPELQVHDFIVGLDYDIVTGGITNNPDVNSMHENDQKRLTNVIEWLKSRRKSR